MPSVPTESASRAKVFSEGPDIEGKALLDEFARMKLRYLRTVMQTHNPDSPASKKYGAFADALPSSMRRTSGEPPPIYYIFNNEGKLVPMEYDQEP